MIYFSAHESGLNILISERGEKKRHVFNSWLAFKRQMSRRWDHLVAIKVIATLHDHECLVKRE